MYANISRFLKINHVSSFSFSKHYFSCTLNAKLHEKIPIYGNRACAFQLLENPKRLNSTQSLKQSYINWFQKITESGPVCSARDVLISIHDISNLPWWSTIILTTISLRLFVTLPLGIYQSYVIAKLQLCKIQFGATVEELKKETAVAIKRFGWSEKQARIAYNYSVKKQWRLLVEKENCHPLKTTMVLWIQLPVWILFSLALRSMAYQMGPDPISNQAIAEQLSNEGCLWLPDLLAADSTGVLPVLVCASNLAIIELQSCSRINHTRLQNIMTNVFRGLAIVSFPIAMTVPCCMSLYWSASSTLALAQNAMMMSPQLRSACGIPETPNQSQRPYRQAWLNFKDKWRLFK